MGRRARLGPSLISEALALLRLGPSVRELALRFRISEVATGVTGGQRGSKVHPGPPRALTAEDESACFFTWSAGEAGLYELAGIYKVTPRAMRNILQREAARQALPRAS